MGRYGPFCHQNIAILSPVQGVSGHCRFFLFFRINLQQIFSITLLNDRIRVTKTAIKPVYFELS